MLCDLVARKNNRLRILQIFWKSVHKKELPYMKFHGFQVRWASYIHNHGIVCSNDPILCTCVYLRKANNIDLESFNFCCIKHSIFIFLVQKIGFFVKRIPKICYKNGPTKFKMILYHTVCTIHHLFAWKKFSRHSSRNWQNFANSIGSGSNLNYRCFIVCSYVFPKIIFRYTSIYFIIDSQSVPQYSTPIYKRSCMPSWMHSKISKLFLWA
jgi:hypothetical protein